MFVVKSYYSLNDLLALKWKIFRRSVSEIPVAYLLLLLLMILAAGYVILKIEVPVNWKSLFVVAVVQLLLCMQIPRNADRKMLLKQYPGVYKWDRFLNYFLISGLFLLLALPFWLVALGVSLLLMWCDELVSCKGIGSRIVLPSPFFLKSSYLWHSRLRYLLPVIWIGILTLEVIAFRVENYELAVVSTGGGSLIAFLVVVMRYEKSDFLRMYVNSSHFMKQTFQETIVNTAVFMILPVVLLLSFFPQQWHVSMLVVLLVEVFNIHLLWIKYLFYPSEALGEVMLIISMLLQWVMVVSIYGVVLLPLYYWLLFRQCKRNIGALISDRITYRS